jgi:hypothetical protein
LRSLSLSLFQFSLIHGLLAYLVKGFLRGLTIEAKIGVGVIAKMNCQGTR